MSTPAAPPPFLSPESLLAALHWRYATKKFDPQRKIIPALLETLLESLRLTASSFGLQPWHFLVVQNPALRAELRKASWNQSQVTDASHHIVICSPLHFGPTEVDAYVATIAAARQQSIENLTPYRNMMVQFLAKYTPNELNQWMEKQCYIALGTLLLAAAELGIDACPMEGFSRPAYDDLLDLPSRGLRSIVACPLGYRHSSDEYARIAKVRLDPDSVFSYL